MDGPRGWEMVAGGRSDDVDDVEGNDDDEVDHGDDADVALVDDVDASWRPQPDRGVEPDASAVGWSRDAPSHEHRSIERIVLNDSATTSAWARPSGAGARRIEGVRAGERHDPPTASGVASATVASSSIDRRRVSTDDGSSSPDPVDSNAATDESGEVPRRHVVWRRPAVVAFAGLVVIAGVVTLVLAIAARGDETDPAIPSTPELATAAEVAWTRRVEGAVRATAAGDGLVVVATGDSIAALTEADGEVAWRRANAVDAGDVERVAVMAGHVVVTQQAASGATEVRAFDPADGTELWRTRGVDGSYSIVGPSHDPMIVGRARVDGGTLLTLLDAADGTPLAEPFRLSGVEVTDGDFGAAPSDRRVAVWSADSVDVVAGPVDAFNLRTVAELDGTIVALDLEGRIVAFDEDGRRADELRLVADDGSGDGADAIAEVDLVGVAGAGVGVVSGETSLGFAVVDGRIETVWQRPGHAGPPTPTSVGHLTVLTSADDGDPGIGETIIDVASGTSITTIVAPGPRERLSMLAWNGFVVAPAVGATERVVSGVGYDGRQLWSLPLSPEADYEVTRLGIVIVEPAPDGVDVSVAR
ncbi:PQQ-binding-like beta-propeller repeat protein [Ilumatobacter sp.]|uniref:outer membrane protein assembly factor BamB family protein n=1 Tax=Ilumatobacter sp. TaxID=1967498 RepID=UPI003AF5A514